MATDGLTSVCTTEPLRPSLMVMEPMGMAPRHLRQPTTLARPTWDSRQMLFKMGIMLFLMPKIMPSYK